MKKIKKVFLFILIGIVAIPIFMATYYFISWKRTEIDANLSKNPIYKTFDQQKQRTIFESDSENVKSNTFKIKVKNQTGEEYYACAIYDQKYNLEIVFKAGDGFSGGGYKIQNLGNRYKINHYSYTDNHSSHTPEEYTKLLESKLILDKSSYKKGDPIFGYVRFKFQNGYGLEKYFEEGEGFFKGIVQ
ncbi:hypothetical protein [Chryseobacterium herbae]|uniref:DUF4352 domain-containing protein n=1 Tax=Chryseobacterium herbae TaxID=2976476 RepID=A0ABT2IVG1_9FLAO|nr:hypothetical protein [Chryseobacterium sp. pc1-10]MCT2562772.1 hypothetical protein [Chryseobacterium sp. pc1-10]